MDSWGREFVSLVCPQCAPGASCLIVLFPLQKGKGVLQMSLLGTQVWQHWVHCELIKRINPSDARLRWGFCRRIYKVIINILMENTNHL